ncbi:MAG: hypothetical protein ABL998_11270 [Planctomycetota bacterium]
MLGLNKILLPVGALFLAGAAACVATRNRDGSITLEFAPDMTITAMGLEDVLDKLTELLDKCITGNYQRPCTQAEMDEINEAIDNVLERKERMGGASSPGLAPPFVV